MLTPLFHSTLFSKTTTATAGTMLGSFLLYVPYFFLGNEFDTMTKLVTSEPHMIL